MRREDNKLNLINREQAMIKDFGMEVCALCRWTMLSYGPASGSESRHAGLSSVRSQCESQMGRALIVPRELGHPSEMDRMRIVCKPNPFGFVLYDGVR
jgi:hypothetical protein